MAKTSIYASKLFKASKYQSKIISAINNPINSELVAQLSEYVDLDSIPATEPISNEPNVNSTNTNNINKSKSNNNLRPGPKSNYTSSRPHINDSGKLDAPEEPIDNDLDDDIDNVDEPSNDDLDSSTQTNSTSIKANTNICNCGDRISTNVILNTLNSLDTTSGVNRVSIKDSDKELWVYYNDSINLNNVMTAVIELLDNSGYYYLTFNRLARTDNAIVFDISLEVSSVATPESDED